MSLDVYLISEKKVKRTGTGVFVRDKGKNIELTDDEVKKRFPGSAVRLRTYETNEVYSGNITHNLGRMAKAAGLYDALWCPEDKGWKLAKDIIPALSVGLSQLKAKPDYYKEFNPPNGWGDYDGLVDFTEAYLKACQDNPDIVIEVSK